MNQNLIQNSFRYGELGPSMYGRSDTEPYQQGAKKVENFLVDPRGGLVRRPGSRFHREVSDSTKATRIVPFETSFPNYLLEFGENYMRVLRQASATLLSPTSGQGFTFPDDSDVEIWYWLASPGDRIFYRISKQIFPYQTGDGPFQISLSGALPGGLSTGTDYWLNVEAFQSGVSAKDITLRSPIAIGFATSKANAEAGTLEAMTSVGTGKVTLTDASSDVHHPTQFVEADMANLQFTRYRDSMKVTCVGKPALNIRYQEPFPTNSNVGSTLRKWVVWHDDYTYGPFAYVQGSRKDYPRPSGDAHLDLNEVGANSLYTAEALCSINSVYTDFSIAAADYLDVDDLFWAKDDAADDWMVGDLQYATYSTTTSLRFDTVIPFTGTPAAAVNAYFYALRQQWRPASEGPRCSGFYGGRLYLAGGGARPHILYGSSLEGTQVFLPADIEDGAVSANTSIAVDVDGDSDQEIATIAVLKSGLLYLTRKSVWAVRPVDPNAGLSATNITTDFVSSYGGAAIQPLKIGRSLVYASPSARKLYSLKYIPGEQEYDAPDDLTLLSEHILGTGCERLAHQHEHESKLWAQRADGQVASLSIVEKEGILGWARQVIGGTGVTVEDAVTMQNYAGDGATLYMVVKRTVNGATKRYIESVADPLSPGFSLKDAFFVDCGATYDGASTTTPTGFDHLDGETVHVLADGAYVGTETVASGTFTLDTAASKVHAGYAYNSDIEMLPPTVASAAGSGEGSLKKVARAVLRVHETVGGKVGPDSSNLESLEYEDEYANALYTGDIEIPIDGEWERDPTIYIRQDEPFPMTVSAVLRRVDASARGGD